MVIEGAIGLVAFLAGGGLAWWRAGVPHPVLRSLIAPEGAHDWHIDGKVNGRVIQHCPHCGATRERD